MSALDKRTSTKKVNQMKDSESMDKSEDGSFVLVGKLAYTEKGLADAQEEILFDNRLRKMALLRQGIDPNEYSLISTVLKYLEVIAVLLYIWILPMFSIPEWCSGEEGPGIVVSC